MIRRTAKLIAMCSVIASAAAGHAATATISPALAACSKALIESLAKADALPAYTVKTPHGFVDAMTDRNAFTVLAHGTRSKQLLAKASCKATPDGTIVSFRTLPLKG